LLTKNETSKNKVHLQFKYVIKEGHYLLIIWKLLLLTKNETTFTV